MKMIDFDLLVGQEAKLYACNELNQFQLGKVIFEVLEDEQDGYRSSMDQVGIVSSNNDTVNFLDDVKIVSTEYGYGIESTTLYHRWLDFGTDHSDYYYPSFEFHFYPLGDFEDRLKELIKV